MFLATIYFCMCTSVANSQVPDKNVRFTDQRQLFLSLLVLKEGEKNCGGAETKKRSRKKSTKKTTQTYHLRIDKTKKCVNACLDKKNTKIFERTENRTTIQWHGEGRKTGNDNLNVHLNIERASEQAHKIEREKER